MKTFAITIRASGIQPEKPTAEFQLIFRILLVSKSINSGAPASTAPPDFSSLGIIASHRNSSVAYCAAEKIRRVRARRTAAFSLCHHLVTYSAASRG